MSCWYMTVASTTRQTVFSPAFFFSSQDSVRPAVVLPVGDVLRPGDKDITDRAEAIAAVDDLAVAVFQPDVPDGIAPGHRGAERFASGLLFRRWTPTCRRILPAGRGCCRRCSAPPAPSASSGCPSWRCGSPSTPTHHKGQRGTVTMPMASGTHRARRVWSHVFFGAFSPSFHILLWGGLALPV